MGYSSTLSWFMNLLILIVLYGSDDAAFTVNYGLVSICTI